MKSLKKILKSLTGKKRRSGRSRSRSSASKTVTPLPRAVRIGLFLWGVVQLIILLAVYITTYPFLDNLTLFYSYLLIMFVLTDLAIWVAIKPLRGFFGLVLACVLFTGFGPPSGLLPPHGGAPEAVEDAPIRVVTYNWLKSNQEMADFERWVRAENPDVVIIQEVPKVLKNNLHRIADLFPYVTHRDISHNVMILSRHPITFEDRFVQGKRDVVRATLALPKGAVDVFGIHAPTIHSEKLWLERNEYLYLASQWIRADKPRVIVAGDFNASPWNKAYRDFVNANSLFEKGELLPRATRILGGTGSGDLGGPVDHILTRQGNRFGACRIGPGMGSDHRPVVCDVYFKK